MFETPVRSPKCFNVHISICHTQTSLRDRTRYAATAGEAVTNKCRDGEGDRSAGLRSLPATLLKKVRTEREGYGRGMKQRMREGRFQCWYITGQMTTPR